jgi:ABC-2 type transport system permease protein
MGALGRIGTLVGYEWKRALAKKKVLALVVLAIAFQTLVTLGVYELTRVAGTASLGGVSVGFMWIVVVSEGLFFVQVIAIVVAGGSMSEEYEHGTADILLSKPIRRLEYMLGKFLGGFSLLVMVEALITLVATILSLAFFGGQNGLQFAPLMFLAIAYSSLIFFSLSFMFSEVFRGTTLAILLALAVFIASDIMEPILSFVYGMSTRALPIWAATSFPSLVLGEVITAQNVVSASDLGALAQAALIIALYAIASILIAAFRLVEWDVTKKTA